MFRPRIMTFFKKVFFEEMLYRAMKQFISINAYFYFILLVNLFIYFFICKLF